MALIVTDWDPCNWPVFLSKTKCLRWDWLAGTVPVPCRHVPTVQQTFSWSSDRCHLATYREAIMGRWQIKSEKQCWASLYELSAWQGTWSLEWNDWEDIFFLLALVCYKIMNEVSKNRSIQFYLPVSTNRDCCAKVNNFLCSKDSLCLFVFSVVPPDQV